jgi:hypothetical protein
MNVKGQGQIGPNHEDDENLIFGEFLNKSL